ncbi:MAG: dihydrodipicolinate synthase family protein, partial [Planctomycetaceae bacterium]|nr:dihydrodipicolinate synthase family protein [Planctomycetaceae bacterium]
MTTSWLPTRERLDPQPDRADRARTAWQRGSSLGLSSVSVGQPARAHLVGTEVERPAGRARVLAGTGSGATAAAGRPTRFSARAGGDGARVVAPSSNRPSQEGLHADFGRIAEAAALPLVLGFGRHGPTGRPGRDDLRGTGPGRRRRPARLGVGLGRRGRCRHREQDLRPGIGCVRRDRVGSEGRGLASAFETPRRRPKRRNLDDAAAPSRDLRAGVGSGRRGIFRRHEQDFLLSVGFARRGRVDRLAGEGFLRVGPGRRRVVHPRDRPDHPRVETMRGEVEPPDRSDSEPVVNLEVWTISSASPRTGAKPCTSSASTSTRTLS